MASDLRIDPVKEYQRHLVSTLCDIFQDVPIEMEWRSVKDEYGLYCPRIDVAIGPFAYGNEKLARVYDDLMLRFQGFIDRVIYCHMQNVSQFDDFNEDEDWVSIERLLGINRNSRCLIAIEVENCVSRKHLIGGAINAAALGRIGMVVAWTPDKLNALIRMRRYMKFLEQVKKNSFNTKNLLILSSNQLLEAIA